MKLTATIIRVLAFLAYGLMIYYISFLWMRGEAVVAFWSSLVVVPFCLGTLAQMSMDWQVKSPYWHVAWPTVVWMAVLILILIASGFEALICVIMAFPILAPAALFGILAARLLLRIGRHKTDITLRASLFFLPLLALPLDRALVFPEAEQTLRSEIVIDATPDEIWAQTLVIPTIQPDERIWTISHNILGTPMPISADLDGDVRSLAWTKGVRFQEIITERILNERLAWRFNFNDLASLASFDPHVSPASEMLRVSDGFYELSELSDGQTLLVLETHYQTRTPLNGYLRLWGLLFLNDFHSSVLAVIKTRAEG